MPILYKYIGKNVVVLHVRSRHDACFPPHFLNLLFKTSYLYGKETVLNHIFYTETVGLHSLSVTHEDIDYLLFVFLCFGSFCVTYSNKGL